MLAARGIIVSDETVRQWALKFGQEFANEIRRRLPCAETNGTSTVCHASRRSVVLY
jgi:transposase-like protein